MVNLITNNLTILYRVKKAFFHFFQFLTGIFISRKNYASLDQMSDLQFTKHFLDVILQKNLAAHPCNAFCCHWRLSPYRFDPRLLVGLDYF